MGDLENRDTLMGPQSLSRICSSVSAWESIRFMLERTVSSWSCWVRTLSSKLHLTSGWSQQGKKERASVAANIVATPSFSSPSAPEYLLR